MSPRFPIGVGTTSSRPTDSAQRRTQSPATENVYVKVMHRLQGIRPVVHDQTVSAIRYAFPRRDPSGGQHQIRRQALIFFRQLSDIGHVFARNDQHVYRRLRLDVAKGHNAVILIDDIGRNLPQRYTAEQTVGHAPV